MFIVDLAPAAARMYDRMAKQALEIESRILERLEPDEVATLLVLLNKVEVCFRDHADRRRASLINAAAEFNRSRASAPPAKRRPAKERMSHANSGARAKWRSSSVSWFLFDT